MLRSSNLTLALTNVQCLVFVFSPDVFNAPPPAVSFNDFATRDHLGSW